MRVPSNHPSQQMRRLGSKIIERRPANHITAINVAPTARGIVPTTPTPDERAPENPNAVLGIDQSVLQGMLQRRAGRLG